MASQSIVPAGAQEMHARLDELGVVALVRAVLLKRDDTLNVTDLVCWVERDRGENYVKAAYMHHKKYPASGKPAGKHPDFARFRVAQGAPFGPMGSAPLADKTVLAVLAMLG